MPQTPFSPTARLSRRHALSLLAASVSAPFVATTAALAAPGAGADSGEIVIGQSVPLSGPAAPSFAVLLEGQDLALKEINDKGGINGRPVKLVKLDDGYDPRKCVENVTRLIDEHKVVALSGLGSTAGVAASLPLLLEKKVPLIGVYTGSPSLRTKQHPYFFTTTASYRDEVVQMIRNQVTLQRSRIGLVYSNNPFGQLMVPVVEEVAKEMGVSIVSRASLEITGTDAVAAAQAIAKGSPQAVIMMAFGTGIFPFIKAARGIVGAPIYCPSVANAKALLDALGDDARGLAYTVTIPYPWRQTTPLMRDYNRAMEEAKHPVDYDHLTGYLNMRVLLAVLARTGKSITSQALVSTLERMKRVDIGGYVLDFSATNHHGSRFVETVIVGPGGRYMR